ncbi:hypothetical protein [Tritonibacter mobilis]|uniref:hypothetical protein n=1 Tax=Tritonibacter mobilis TaxID=379347 RepID=UPI00398F9342
MRPARDPRKHSGNPEIKKVPIPSVLSLRKNSKETLEFLAYASRQNRRNRKVRRKGAEKPNSYFDFVELREICPATALILCSIYDVYQMRGGDFEVFDYDSWHPEVKKTFERIGFFKWLDFKGIPSSFECSVDLPINAFESESLHIPERPILYFQNLVSAFNASRQKNLESTIDEGTSRRVASSVLEAVENSVRHAYHQGIPKDIRRRWWVGGVSNPSSGQVMVACYDCGISIPGSIEVSDFGDERGVRRYVRDVLGRYLRMKEVAEAENELDHKRLEVALRYLSSTSGVDGGGKGLAHIASTIDECEDGSVEIFTRRAHFHVKKDGHGRCDLLPAAMPGTLIIWRMQLYPQSS